MNTTDVLIILAAFWSLPLLWAARALVDFLLHPDDPNADAKRYLEESMRGSTRVEAIAAALVLGFIAAALIWAMRGAL